MADLRATVRDEVAEYASGTGPTSLSMRQEGVEKITDQFLAYDMEKAARHINLTRYRRRRFEGAERRAALDRIWVAVHNARAATAELAAALSELSRLDRGLR